MSTQTPPIPTHRSHRHTRSAALPTPAAASQNPQNPHYLNLQSHGGNSQIGMSQSPQPTTPPRTPQKSEHGASIQYGSQLSGSESVSKPRSRGKNRSKNATASPGASKNDRSTPPLTGMQSGGMAATTTTTTTRTRPISTPSAAAYAGPTFHASPAPSALPIPSFYSKSVPDSPGIKTLQTKKEETPSSSVDSPTPPPAKVAAAQPQGKESPLDFFFKADREEKARARSASSFYGTASESGPFQPPSDSPQNKPDNLSTGSQSRTRSTHFSGGSTSALFAMELDGTNSPGKPYGPAFSTPYNERINAARSSATSLQSPSQKSQGQQQSTDRSEALKAYLFSTQNRSPPVTCSDDISNLMGSPADQAIPGNALRNTSSTYGGQRGAGPPSRSHHNSFPYMNDAASSRHSPRGGSRSSGLRQEVTPTTTPFQVPEQAPRPYPTPPSPSRPPRQDTQSVSRTSGGNSDTARSSSYTSASQPAIPSGSRSTEFKEMEDSLRRILKLEPAKDTNIQATGISRMPEAAASVPNYVGGRAPPMNGMHNGVMGS
jgi:hypothetical protein